MGWRGAGEGLEGGAKIFVEKFGNGWNKMEKYS
jgi:hypothetical protein